jgi:hypothetical protein
VDSFGAARRSGNFVPPADVRRARITPSSGEIDVAYEASGTVAVFEIVLQ